MSGQEHVSIALRKHESLTLTYTFLREPMYTWISLDSFTYTCIWITYSIFKIVDAKLNDFLANIKGKFYKYFENWKECTYRKILQLTDICSRRVRSQVQICSNTHTAFCDIYNLRIDLIHCKCDNWTESQRQGRNCIWRSVPL